jgi:hypothetical protein
MLRAGSCDLPLRSTKFMQSLPTELQGEILRYLPETALSALSETCRRNSILATPLLYRKLAINIRLESTTRSPSQKIKSYAANNWDRFRYLKSIAIACREPAAWPLKGRDMLVSLYILLIHLPPTGLISFAWEVEYSTEPDILRHLPRNLGILDTDASLVDYSRPFDNMLELTCRRLSFKNADYFMQQLLHVGLHLQRLCISLDSSATFALSPSLLEALRHASDNKTLFSQLKHLELHNIYFQEWPFPNMSSVQTLSLQRCPNVDVALADFVVQRPNFARLKKLSLFLCSESKSISAVLQYFQEVADIEELHFLMQGYNHYPLNWIVPFSRTLNHLVLESRQAWTEPTTVNPYHLEDFLSVVNTCTSLKTLGIPVVIEKSPVNSTIYEHPNRRIA